MADWTEDAVCAQVGGEPFYPERYSGDDMRDARALCAQCPVRRACLKFALGVERGVSPWLRFGVWGGLTPRQRYRRDVQTHPRYYENRLTDVSEPEGMVGPQQQTGGSAA